MWCLMFQDISVDICPKEKTLTLQDENRGDKGKDGLSARFPFELEMHPLIK